MTQCDPDYPGLLLYFVNYFDNPTIEKITKHLHVHLIGKAVE